MSFEVGAVGAGRRGAAKANASQEALIIEGFEFNLKQARRERSPVRVYAALVEAVRQAAEFVMRLRSKENVAGDAEAQ